MEEALCEYIKTIDNMFCGLTLKSLRRLAFDFAEKNKIQHRFDKESRTAGKSWLRGLMKRHDTISLRQPASTSVARAIGFNKPQIELFYNNLLKVMQEYNSPAHSIYNIDES